MLGLLNFTSYVASAGYAAIFVLSLLQSCCVPTSSELTLGFAGVLAAEGKLNLAGVIVAGVAGELVGAYIAWFLGRYGGRTLVDRYGRYVLLSHHDLDRAEGWFSRHEKWGVLGSRLLPVIRNFVALLAGVAEVPLLRFGVLTALGSLIWLSAMAGIGYGLGNSYTTIMHGFSYAGYLLAAAAVAAVAFVIWHRLRAYRAATGPSRSAAPSRSTARSAPAPGRRYQPAHTRQDAVPPSPGPGRRPVVPPPVPGIEPALDGEGD